MTPNSNLHCLIIGATGASGRELLAQLLADPTVGRVDCYGRRAPAVVDGKLRSHILDLNDFDPALVEGGDVLFSCLGTTRAAAGGKEAQWRIDYEAVLHFARVARSRGVATLVLVSAAGANGQSRFFYPRLKGQLEEALRALDFPRLLIFRPPLLLRPNSDRPGERFAAGLLKFLNGLGLLRSQQPLAVADLARALRRAQATAPAGVHCYDPAAIRRLLAE